MPNVCNMLLDSLSDGSVCFTNVGCATRTRNHLNTLHVFRVDRVLYRSEEISNSTKGFESRGDIIPSKDMGNLVCGSLDKREVNLGNRIHSRRFSF